MLIIIFIHTYILYSSVTARPTQLGSVFSLTSNNGWMNITSRTIPARLAISTVSPADFSRNIKSRFQPGTPILHEQLTGDIATSPTVPGNLLFNASVPQREAKAVAVKYSQAARYLRGSGLLPLRNFTCLSGLLGNNNPTTQVSGSSFVLNLQTYGADIAYYGQIGLGSPPQAVLFDVDTGSADLWVPSGCAKCDPRRTQFQPTSSSTYFDTGQPFTLAYGTGHVDGAISQETVAMGELSIRHQYFGAVSKESNDFSDLPFNGIIGMAFSSISALREPTFMERLIQERQVNAAVFSCYDPSKYTGAISWNPVTSQTYWSISLNNVQVDGINTAIRTITAAIDTGTSLIYLPQDLADTLYAQIPGAARAPQYGSGLYTYPCLHRPAVSLVFGTQSYEINLQDFNLGRTAVSGCDCIGGILATGHDLSPDLAIIGDEFLKSWYSIYDYGQGSRVGFARSINNR